MFVRRPEGSRPDTQTGLALPPAKRRPQRDGRPSTAGASDRMDSAHREAFHHVRHLPSTAGSLDSVVRSEGTEKVKRVSGGPAADDDRDPTESSVTLAELDASVGSIPEVPEDQIAVRYFSDEALLTAIRLRRNVRHAE